jgi:dihydrofolate synthase/folylpolyglutamate synthase
MEYEEVIEFLNEQYKPDINLGLGRVESLLGKMDNPHKKIKTVHVGGTNGKGSVCAMISSILQEAGYKVGMYTSPHLIDFRERIKINNRSISKEDLVRLAEGIKPLVDDQTRFEIATSLAFQYFLEEGVDVAVIEVGLGGRLDSTNVLEPMVSVITNVGMDHMKYLGSSISEIAWEKAGIVKSGGVLVTAAEGEALDVVKQTCEKEGSELVKVMNPVDVRGVEVGLCGDFQRINGAVAVKVVNRLEDFGFSVREAAVRRGLGNVEWSGRMDWRGNILLDCAHNLEGAGELRRELEKLDKGVVMVLGISDDKNIRGIMETLSPVSDKVILTRSKLRRSKNPEKMGEVLKEFREDFVLKDGLDEALSYAREIAGEGVICVTGSIFVVGEALQILDREAT